MQLIGVGRTAEVFEFSEGQVVKLDRIEFQGLSDYEASVLRKLAHRNLPLPREFGTVQIDGRHGVVLERFYGPLLTELIQAHSDLQALADEFVELHFSLSREQIAGISSLNDRLIGEVSRSGLPGEVINELTSYLTSNTSPNGLCHFDLHPDNVIVSPEGMKIIDWLNVGMGSTHADFARTLLLRIGTTDHRIKEFMIHVKRLGQDRREIADEELQMWTRVVAVARMSEGFDQQQIAFLRDIALG